MMAAGEICPSVGRALKLIQEEWTAQTLGCSQRDWLFSHYFGFRDDNPLQFSGNLAGRSCPLGRKWGVWEEALWLMQDSISAVQEPHTTAYVLSCG